MADGDEILEDYYGKPNPSTLWGKLQQFHQNYIAPAGSASLPSQEPNVGSNVYEAVGKARDAVGGPQFDLAAGIGLVPGVKGRLPQRVGFSGPVPQARSELPAPAILNEKQAAVQDKFSGIYKNPKEIISEVRLAPDNGNMAQLWGPEPGLNKGLTRENLYDIGQQGTRRGDMMPEEFLQIPPGAKGSDAAKAAMNPANTQRILDVLAEADKVPGLLQGMGGWYIHDPMFWRLQEMYGTQEAIIRYSQLNQSVASFSPAAGVETEIPRGLAFNHLATTRGLEGVQDFVTYGGAGKFNPKNKNPEHLGMIGIEGVPGHAYHKSAQMPSAVYSWANERQKGEVPKVATYAASSGVPETRFQTEWPVGDSHWTRAVDLPKYRGAGGAHDATMSEMTDLGPWWKEDIAGARGKHSVHDQGLLWGAMSRQTGVKTPIGKSKLEMISDHIMRRAQQRGVSPQTMRDMILSGEAYAPGGFVDETPGGAILEQYYGRGGKVRRGHFMDGGSGGDGDGSGTGGSEGEGASGSSGGEGDGGGAGSEGGTSGSSGSDGVGGEGPGMGGDGGFGSDAGTSVGDSGGGYGGQEGNDAGMGGPGNAGIGGDASADAAAAAAAASYGMMGDAPGVMGTSVSGPDSMDAGVAAANAAAMGTGFGSMGATGFGPGQAYGTDTEAMEAIGNMADARSVDAAANAAVNGNMGFGAGFGMGPSPAAVEASPGPGPATANAQAEAIANAMGTPGPVSSPATTDSGFSSSPAHTAANTSSVSAPGPAAPGPGPATAAASPGPGPSSGGLGVGMGMGAPGGGSTPYSSPFDPAPVQPAVAGNPYAGLGSNPNVFHEAPFTDFDRSFAGGGPVNAEQILEQYYGGGGFVEPMTQPQLPQGQPSRWQQITDTLRGLGAHVSIPRLQEPELGGSPKELNSRGDLRRQLTSPDDLEMKPMLRGRVEFGAGGGALGLPQPLEELVPREAGDSGWGYRRVAPHLNSEKNLKGADQPPADFNSNMLTLDPYAAHEASPSYPSWTWEPGNVSRFRDPRSYMGAFDANASDSASSTNYDDPNWGGKGFIDALSKIQNMEGGPWFKPRDPNRLSDFEDRRSPDWSKELDVVPLLRQYEKAEGEKNAELTQQLRNELERRSAMGDPDVDAFLAARRRRR